MDLLSRLLEADENGSGCNLSADEVRAALDMMNETEAVLRANGLMLKSDWVRFHEAETPEPQDP